MRRLDAHGTLVALVGGPMPLIVNPATTPLASLAKVRRRGIRSRSANSLLPMGMKRRFAHLSAKLIQRPSVLYGRSFASRAIFEQVR